ncbi:UPF0182 family membrane protein [Pseudogracilibacillus sp. ICA-222130]|uniref:UPF0182 family membrane protein n=1 Tax=Pseudogracilibacillus sp. ICA-222130 TaxID=3134655 RepID=UPI0030BB7753
MKRQNQSISPEQMEAYIKKIKTPLIWLAIIFVLFIVVTIGFQLFTDYIWIDSIGFSQVFMTILSSKVLLAVAGFILFFILSFLTFYFIRFSFLRQFTPVQLPSFIAKGKMAYSLIIIASAIVGVIGSVIVKGVGWEKALKFLYFVPFNEVDPYFGKDVSFYMFQLPFIEFILYTLVNLFFFFLIVQIAAYSVFYMYRVSRSAQIHLATTFGVLGLLLAGIHYLGRYNTLLTDQVNIFQKSVVHGLSFTDKFVNIPKAYVLAAVAIIAAIWMMVVLFKGKIMSAIRPILMYVIFIVLGQLASFGVQNFMVSPNEFSREEPFLEHNLQLTRAAYGLDDIEQKESPGDATLTEEMVERNDLTLHNVRLNDSRPLLDIYNQLQTFRTYYQFNDMDIDRYEVDGEYEQVFIGARELSTNDLPDQAKTWVNKNLRYTHGYGVSMSHVNKVTGQGQPEYMLRNIPVEGSLEVTQPQIYFGEEDYPSVITNSKVDEFDYPTGDENATNRYEADLGIPLKGINKVLFAIKEGSFRTLFSDQLTKESQLLKHRNIIDRVNEIAPFFTYDDDPYIIVREDGSLAWIIDGYVRSDGYPYSEAYDGKENYIRNSVKAVVDAYSGEVNFYMVDEEDPLVQTYAKMFPDLFTEEIPEDVHAHFRYPVDLFKIQAKMYGTYHMSNLEVFYNREDYWEFPTEKYFNEDIEMDPYYITMKMAEEDKEEFILMMPYTPKKRQNMIAWMGVRNDGENYGDMFVYRFPKQKNVYGPQQIENRINQDSYISQQLNLWSQGGSKVIRGNLLVIPIEDTVLYVEPVYIESSNETSLPEVKQVIMAYEDHIVMEETFDKAVEKILKLVESGVKPEDVPEEPLDEDVEEGSDESNEEQDGSEEVPPIMNADETLQEISTLFDDYQKAMQDGNWAEAGEIMEQIEARLQTVE